METRSVGLVPSPLRGLSYSVGTVTGGLTPAATFLCRFATIERACRSRLAEEKRGREQIDRVWFPSPLRGFGFRLPP